MNTLFTLSRAPRTVLAAGALILSIGAARAQTLQITTIAGSPQNYGSADGQGTVARFQDPSGLALDASGNIYVADLENSTIRKVTPAGVVTTLAGTAGVLGSADGTGPAASFHYPTGITMGPDGNLYVTDTGNASIRKVTPAGVVTTFAGHAGTIGYMDATGTAAFFDSPQGIVADQAGNLYVADTENYVIRKVTPAGVVTTLAGTAGARESSDGTGYGSGFNYPSGIAIDSAGTLYVADVGNEEIRKVAPNGVISTLAGSAAVAGNADGVGSAVRFSGPDAVAVDGLGNVYVVDANNFEIRLVTPSGSVSTIAGSPNNGFSDGVGSGARFGYAEGIALDASGNVYIADSGNQIIRKGVSSGSPTIGTAPLTQSAGVGNAVTFKVGASSATQLSYQWSVNGKAVSGATSATYTTSPIQLSDQGIYSVAVTNSTGTTTTAASLTATFLHDSTTSFNAWSAANPLPAGTSYTAVAFDGSNFLTVGLDGTAYYSADGITWKASASNGPPGQVWGELNSVANIPGKNMLVSVGNGGAIVTFASGSYGGTLQTSGSTGILTGVAAGGSTLVAVGYGGTSLSSNLSATTWTSSTTGTSQNLNAIAYGNGTFVAVGLGGTVVTSPDGSKWTTQQLGSQDDLYGVTYGQRGFVAVGSNGGIFVSPDGALWIPEASTTGNVLVHVGYGDGQFVAIGLLGTIVTSSDEGITWASQNSGTLARLDGVALGSDSFVLTGTGGIVETSNVVDTSRIANLSARATVGTGANILIAGFVVGGTGSKDVLLRGVGPSLAQFAITGALPQAHLSLLDSTSTQIAANSVWGGGSILSNAFTAVGAFPIPATSDDAALLQPLGSGSYTAQLSGVSNATGVGLAEIYDADDGPSTARLVNISARALVGSGSSTLIAGFVISGATPEKVLIRGIGPTLAQFNVAGSLSAPQLVLYDKGNSALQSNSGWGGGASLTQAMAQVGAFSLSSTSADAAILVTLPPGQYTAEVTGVGGATGIGLAEIYEVK